jgi:hypothetical protein
VLVRTATNEENNEQEDEAGKIRKKKEKRPDLFAIQYTNQRDDS